MPRDLPPHILDLQQTARAMPELPGVYLWTDARGNILYVGKAVNLRARVISYFSRARHERRTRDLLTRSRALQYEVVHTELDALFRESTLIKQLQPPFNRALKNPRTHFYLKLDGSTPDPYLELTRERDDAASLYFGPFRTARVARETMRFVHDVLPLRKCTRINPRCRPCMYYQMRTCAAPLLDEMHRQRHRQAIGHLHDLLDGRSDRVLSWLTGKRDRLSENLMYERAAEVQERIDALHELNSRQAILDAAVQCRCVLIRSLDRVRGTDRLLIVAHGSVLSTRDANLDSRAAAHWVRLHLPLAAALDDRAEDTDAASVLERWIAARAADVRWVAVRHDASPDDMEEAARYVLQDVAVPV